MLCAWPRRLHALLVCDVVIVHDDALPRGHWKVDCIQELFVGGNHLPLVRVATRDKQHTLLRRPLQQLYPLEIHRAKPLPRSLAGDVTNSKDVTTPEPEPGSSTGLSTDLEDAPPSGRQPVRAAAKAATQKT